MKRLLLTFAKILLGTYLFAQGSVSGSVIDSVDSSPLIGASIFLLQKSDSAFLQGTVTDVTSIFRFDNVKEGEYLLHFTYISYKPIYRNVIVESKVLDLGAVKMSVMATMLNTLEITANAIPVEQKGDTLQYNASAFQTDKNASAEELITKMPGITVEGGEVKAQGENVHRVLVDGKLFFGDDAMIALKNLPAEIIEKIEVFDKLSDQAQFTGFDDGQTQKTINIVTKRGMRNGKFGKVNGGIADNGRYLTSGSINSFKDERKLTVITQSNNVNQQNFSSEDLSGISGGDGRSNATRNFRVGQRQGITTTHAAGLNFANTWGTKLEVSASYFYNSSDNDRFTTLSRNYIASDTGLVYNEGSESSHISGSHRVNARVEYKIDTMNSLVFSPRLNWYNDQFDALSESISTVSDTPENKLVKNNKGERQSYNLGGNVLFRHRFAKRGRSLSIGFDTNIDDRNGMSSLYSINQNFENGQLSTINQIGQDTTRSIRYSSNISYTEPVGTYGQIQVNYVVAQTSSDADKRTFDRNVNETSSEPLLNHRLSNVFETGHWSNRGGISYRYNLKRKVNLMAGINVQEARLQNFQAFPSNFVVQRSFINCLPHVSANLKFGEGRTIRVDYRTATYAPSVSQLQNAVNNSNPLFLRTGNADLKQDYHHSITIRLNKTDVEAGKSLVFFLFGAYIKDYIGNSTVFNNGADSLFVNDVMLAPGHQLVYPVNATDSWNGRTFVTYGTPVKFIRSNLNFNTGANYRRTPAIVDGRLNLSHNYTLSQRVGISSNIDKNIDFNFSFSASYTLVHNTVSERSNTHYVSYRSSLKSKIQPWKGVVVSSDLSHSLFNGISSSLDQQIWFWNAALGYRLFEEALEIRLSGFDVLNRNTNINRRVTDTFIEDSRTNVLGRYWMLGVIYNFRKF